MPKPILKWVGGKTQIIEKVISHFPENINSYHEPFVGGGSVLLKFLEYIDSGKIKINPSVARSKNIYAYDANKWLIMLYSNIKDDVERHLLLLGKSIWLFFSSPKAQALSEGFSTE